MINFRFPSKAMLTIGEHIFVLRFKKILNGRKEVLNLIILNLRLEMRHVCYFIVTRLLGQYLFPRNHYSLLVNTRRIIVNRRAIPVKDDLICHEIVMRY